MRKSLIRQAGDGEQPAKVLFASESLSALRSSPSSWLLGDPSPPFFYFPPSIFFPLLSMTSWESVLPSLLLPSFPLFPSPLLPYPPRG